MNWLNRLTGVKPKPATKQANPNPPRNRPTVVTPPGRVSVPDDTANLYMLKETVKLVSPSFRTELIPLLRTLYKVNPDVGIAIQDMFKLSNTSHAFNFPNNTDGEARAMKQHLTERSKKWSTYTAGINGLVNKMLVQCYVSGAISIEAVPSKHLDGLSTIVFVNPETIKFQRLTDGVYHPYQVAKNHMIGDLIKLNTETYFYVSMFNDTDEPYGIPPFLSALDSLDGQAVMKGNFKNMMDQAGMLGFLEATITKSSKKANESETAYASRLTRELVDFKTSIKDGMTDGILVGHDGDHEFKFNATTKDMANVDKFWTLNQQSVANGLSVNGNIIGIANANTEGGAGIMLSKMISQLRNIQMLVSFVLEQIYTLELRLAGFNNKGIKVTFGTSTVSDELKVQQGVEIKIRNLNILYKQGIISQDDYAWAVGYDKPDQREPREDPTEDISDSVKKDTREKDKDTGDRGKRDKDKVNPKRSDQDPRPRTK